MVDVLFSACGKRTLFNAMRTITRGNAMTRRTVLYQATTEGIGTFLLVFMGSVAYLLLPTGETLTPLVSALLLGGSFFFLTLWGASRSGAHFNPLVTLLFAFTGYVSWWNIPFYLGAQMLGGLGGALVLRLLAGLVPSPHTFPPQGFPFLSLGVETLLTLTLLLLVLIVATNNEQTGTLGAQWWLPALTLSVFVTFGFFLSDSLSWAAMNPLQPFSFAVETGQFGDQWTYWLGSFLAVVAMVLIYWKLRRGALLVQIHPIDSTEEVPLPHRPDFSLLFLLRKRK
jgi:aquaporin Z